MACNAQRKGVIDMLNNLRVEGSQDVMLQSERQQNASLNEELTKTENEIATLRKKLEHFGKSTRILERNLQGYYFVTV